MAGTMQTMLNIRNEASQRHDRQKEHLLLEALRRDIQCETQKSRASFAYFDCELWQETKPRDAIKNVRSAKKAFRYGSHFLQECRYRKVRDSLSYRVIGRCADKEPHDNSLATPFLTMCSRTKAKATYHEWLDDSLPTPANNIQIEGDDASGGTAVPAVRYGNYVQDSSAYAVVTDDQQAVDSAGDVNKMQHQVAKRMASLKLDVEFALVQNNKSSAGSATVARQLGSLESWLWGSRVAAPAGSGGNTLAAATLGNSITAGSSEATTPSFASLVVAGPTDSSSTNAFVVAELKAVIKNCWVAGGDPQIIMVGAAQKQVVSGFAGIATLYREAGKTSAGTAIIGAADLYVSDFGEHRVIPNRIQRNRTAFVLDMDFWSVAYLRSISQKEIARTGSSMKRFIDVAYTLVAKNPSSSGKISDLS